MSQRICFVTCTRAEYGLLVPLIRELKSNPNLIIQLVVGGAHLSSKHGFTVDEITADSFDIDAHVPFVSDADSLHGTCLAISQAISGFSSTFAALNPDLLIVLGDRYEILSASIASSVLGIPIAHLHGGELSLGSLDDSFRHAITKLSTLHFVATESYRKRVIQLGENPNTVHNVGGLGVDVIKSIKLMSKSDLEASLGVTFLQQNLLVTYHPNTSDPTASKQELSELLDALDRYQDTLVLITMPNADSGGIAYRDAIKSYCSSRPNAFCFQSLGQQRYLSCLQYVTAVVGNSSSGLTEVPSFKKPTLNVGSRQDGRLKASSVFDCEATSESIASALDLLFEGRLDERAASTVNPYGTGGAALAISDIIAPIDLTLLRKKPFYDMPSYPC